MHFSRDRGGCNDPLIIGVPVVLHLRLRPGVEIVPRPGDAVTETDEIIKDGHYAATAK